MTWDGDSTPTGLRTIEICVPGANCTWCFNDATARLADLDGVEEVTGSILDGSIADQCSNVPTALLVSTLRTYLHGSDDSSHECQMVAVEPELVPFTGRDGLAPAARNTGLDTATTMETLTEAVQCFRVAGYLADFVASPQGDLRCRSRDTGHAPETTEIRETVRWRSWSTSPTKASFTSSRSRARWPQTLAFSTPVLHRDVCQIFCQIR